MEENYNSRRSAPLLKLDFRLNAEEIFACLKQDSRLRGNGKKWVHTAILSLMVLFFVTGYFFDGMSNPSSLFLAVASLIVLVVIWMIPKWQMYRQAQLLEEDGFRIHLQLYETEIVFDGKNPVTTKLKDIKPVISGDMIILLIGCELVGIPRRAVADEEFQLLRNKLGYACQSK